MTRTKRILCVLGVGAAAATVAVAPALSTHAASRRTLYIAASARSLPNTAFVRTRDCLRRPRRCVNGVRGLELVYLTKGHMPARKTSATVLTDTACAPDAYGVSHCSNIMRLASGHRLAVRHDHRMMNDPCLSPGERVSVRILTRH